MMSEGGDDVENETHYESEVEKIRNIPIDERGKYYERFFYNLILESDKKGMSFRKAGITPAYIKKITKINDNTVDKYLYSLFLKRKVYRIKIGNSYKYFPNGRVLHAITDRDITLGDKRYRVYQIRNPDGDFFYLQEKEIDDNGFEEIVGGITIPKEGVMKIIEVMNEALAQNKEIDILEE